MLQRIFLCKFRYFFNIICCFFIIQSYHHFVSRISPEIRHGIYFRHRIISGSSPLYNSRESCLAPNGCFSLAFSPICGAPSRISLRFYGRRAELPLLSVQKTGKDGALSANRKYRHRTGPLPFRRFQPRSAAGICPPDVSTVLLIIRTAAGPPSRSPAVSPCRMTPGFSSSQFPPSLSSCPVSSVPAAAASPFSSPRSRGVSRAAGTSRASVSPAAGL